MQRCKLVMDQVTEARDTMMKVLDHKEKVLKLLNKNGTVKKSSKLKRKERAWAPPLWRGTGAAPTLVLLMICLHTITCSPPSEWTQVTKGFGRPEGPPGTASHSRSTHKLSWMVNNPLYFVPFFWPALLTEFLPPLLIQRVTLAHSISNIWQVAVKLVNIKNIEWVMVIHLWVVEGSHFLLMSWACRRLNCSH